MIRCSHKSMVLISGMLWAGIGTYLLALGLHFLVAQHPGSTPLLSLVQGVIGTSKEVASIVWVSVALYIGFLKGKIILGRTAKRGIDRILSLPNPASLQQLFGFKYILLIGIMIALGLSLKWIGVPTDVRGVVDTAVGAALIQGSMIYFRKKGL